MSLYAVEIDLENPNVSHTQVIDLVGRDKRVLDVGCWTGEVGRILRGRGCTVSGLEIDEDAAAIASKVLDRVVVADLDSAPLSSHFEGEAFDVIIFADVLEHLADPVAVLSDARRLLAPGGRFVISIPNVTHGSLRLALLQGRWRTTDTGLLDRTHIKFYSREGLLGMLEEAGVVAEQLRGTIADPLDVEVDIDESRLPDHVVEWVRDQPDALVYQFQLSAVPVEPGAPAVSRVELQLAGDPDVVRRRDEHTQAQERVRRDALAMKDHVIGLQAEATTARVRAERLQKRVGRMRETIKELRAADREKAAEIEQLRRRGFAGFARRVKRRLLD